MLGLSTVDFWVENGYIKSPLCESKEAGSEVCPNFFYTKFYPDILSVRLNCLGRQIQQISNLFGRFAVLYEVCNLNLFGRKF